VISKSAIKWCSCNLQQIYKKPGKIYCSDRIEKCKIYRVENAGYMGYSDFMIVYDTDTGFLLPVLVASTAPQLRLS
jgi:hypothetical protein